MPKKPLSRIKGKRTREGIPLTPQSPAYATMITRQRREQAMAEALRAAQEATYAAGRGPSWTQPPGPTIPTSDIPLVQTFLDFWRFITQLGGGSPFTPQAQARTPRTASMPRQASFVATRPTNVKLGEFGPERVQVTPFGNRPPGLRIVDGGGGRTPLTRSQAAEAARLTGQAMFTPRAVGLAQRTAQGQLMPLFSQPLRGRIAEAARMGRGITPLASRPPTRPAGPRQRFFPQGTTVGQAGTPYFRTPPLNPAQSLALSREEIGRYGASPMGEQMLAAGVYDEILAAEAAAAAAAAAGGDEGGYGGWEYPAPPDPWAQLDELIAQYRKRFPGVLPENLNARNWGSLPLWRWQMDIINTLIGNIGQPFEAISLPATPGPFGASPGAAMRQFGG